MKQEMKRRKKFFNRKIILEKLLTFGEVSVGILLGLVLEFLDVAKAMTLPPRLAQRELRKQKPPHYVEIDLKSKVAFWSLLSKLKKEGLITSNRGQIALTKKGIKFLQETSNRFPPNKKYRIEGTAAAQEIILVIFDIPEEEKHKRKWLRFQLRQFGFNILQKSVWQGTTSLPKEFIKDLKKFKILPYVHIFTVKRKGTLSNN